MKPRSRPPTNLGGMFRTGIEIRHFRFALEYNLIGSTSQTVTEVGTGTMSTVSTSNNYLGLKMGFFIGGGKLL